MDLTQYLPEIIVGLTIGGFAWAFKSWSATLERSSERIIEKLDKLAMTFQEHRLVVEKRVTRIETEVEGLKRRMELCDISRKAAPQKIEPTK